MSCPVYRTDADPRPGRREERDDKNAWLRTRTCKPYRHAGSGPRSGDQGPSTPRDSGTGIDVVMGVPSVSQSHREADARAVRARGFVARVCHPEDRRAFLVRSTEEGRAAKDEAIRILDQQQERFLAPVTTQERALLGELFKRLHDHRIGMDAP